MTQINVTRIRSTEAFGPALMLLLAIVPLPGTGSYAVAASMSGASGAALPDSGLFRPVAAELRANLTRLGALPGTSVTPERVRLLLATGQSDAAAALADRLSGDPREVRLVRARLALARQDFASARPLLDAIAAEATPTDGERGFRYAWDAARDDAPSIDQRARARIASGAGNLTLDLLAAGRLAYDRLDYARADSCFTRARDGVKPGDDEEVRAARARAETGLALVLQKRRDWDGSLVHLRAALDAHASPEALETLSQTLIRLGRTDDAIAAVEWGVRLDPYHDPSHYMLGNGYARRNYRQLFAAVPGAFADATGRSALARADRQLAAGQRVEARASYGSVVHAHPTWADARVRLASLDFEDGRFDEARDGCFAALRSCPEYGRAHAVLAKTLEAQRFAVDIHRPDYERRFAAAPMPEVPGIERFVSNWASLSPRHQKRVALSVAPWKAFVPVLVDGGATYYIKPMYMLLSECPAMETLRDVRIDYDSRLWDDVRGCGGYHTVTGIEDVERTIFDRYNTVLHELTHQVHGVLPADDSRIIQDLYRRAKERDDSTHDGFLSRYAGGSVYEYFAEGANALESPQRDAYDPREIVRERLDRMDPDLRVQVERFFARTDVGASYPVAYASGGDDRVTRGHVDQAIPLYRRALERSPAEETALISLANALVLGGHAAAAESAATRAVAAHPGSGPARVALASARWHAGRGLDRARSELAASRALVSADDRWQVDLALGAYAWTAGDVAQALAAYDSVLAYQSDSPEGLRGRASSLALAGRWNEAFPLYDQAVRIRTGVVDLRCELARDLLRAGRVDAARTQLAEATLLDEQNPTAEALRGWAALEGGDLAGARAHVKQSLAWGPWCDLARVVSGGIEQTAGDHAAAERAWAPVRERIEKHTPPSFVYREHLSVWEETHALPAVERGILDGFAGGARPAAGGH